MASDRTRELAKVTRPKFKIGQKVTYRGNRRLRRIVTDRYWDPTWPGWRYRMNEKGMRPDLATCWAVIESELLAVPTPEVKR